MAGLLALSMACGSGRHSSAGFRLPDDGNAVRGKIAFAALECHTCHEVSGVDLPRPTVQPPVPVVLGGEISREMADGYLVSAIINPNYQLTVYPRPQITSAGQSRMPSYADRITVRELIDVVAFLQANYTERAPAPACIYR
jgi:hypothetical protein